MEIVALLVAIVAALFAGLAWRAARRSAAAAEEANELRKSQLRAEPKVIAAPSGPSGEWQMATLQNDSAAEARVSDMKLVAIVDGDEQDFPTTARTELHPGEPCQIRFNVPRGVVERIRNGLGFVVHGVIFDGTGPRAFTAEWPRPPARPPPPD
jgi:hypothetical protein